MIKHYSDKRQRRRLRVKAKIKKAKNRLRLCVFRSNKYIYGQLIDDRKGHTLAAISDQKYQKGTKIERANQAGMELGKKAVKQGIKKVVFDRNGYRYHGRVKAFAEGARKAGLEF